MEHGKNLISEIYGKIIQEIGGVVMLKHLQMLMLINRYQIHFVRIRLPHQLVAMEFRINEKKKQTVEDHVGLVLLLVVCQIMLLAEIPV